MKMTLPRTFSVVLPRLGGLALLALLVAGPAHAGLLTSPRGTYQLWFPREWVVAAEDEIVPEVDPGCCSIVILEPFLIGPEGLLPSLREQVRSKRGGAVVDAGAFVGLADREGAVVTSVRLRGTGLYNMAWAAVPLGDGRASLVALRTVNTSITSLYRSAFLEMAGTAALKGDLQDLPLDDLRVEFRKVWDARGVAGPPSTPAP